MTYLRTFEEFVDITERKNIRSDGAKSVPYLSP